MRRGFLSGVFLHAWSAWSNARNAIVELIYRNYGGKFCYRLFIWHGLDVHEMNKFAPLRVLTLSHGSG